MNDGSPETKTGSASIDANSVWGDYQLSIEGFPEDFGAVYGAFITTSDNYVYVMRHEQNIWRQGAIAWSVGFKTEEPHGNKLDYDIYADSQGKTIDKITYITKDGYVTYDYGKIYRKILITGNYPDEDMKRKAYEKRLGFFQR